MSERKDRGKMMKPPADATHCGGYPTKREIDTSPEAVGRYRPFLAFGQTGIEAHPQGQLASYDDYAALSAKLKAAEAEVARLTEVVKSAHDFMESDYDGDALLVLSAALEKAGEG